MKRIQVAQVILSLAFGFTLGLWINSVQPQSASVRSVVYRCPAWVTVTRSNVLPHWSLTDCVWQDVDTSGGNHNLYFSVVDQFGAPITAYAHLAWPDGDVAQITLGGQTNFGLYGGSFDPNRGQVGAYCGYIESRALSDVVCGMGLPLNRHVNYILSYQQVANPVQPTPTQGAPTPTPVPSDYITRGEFRNLLISTLIDILTKGK